MERDTFIIAVFCCIADLTPILLGTKSLRKGGFSPQLTDAEVMTIEVCGEFLKLSTDKDIFQYFYSHYRHFFPTLTDRTLFVRQAANLWVIKQQLWQLLVRISGEDNAPVHCIDTLPIPVCRLARACRERCLQGIADYGYCAAQKTHYYGFKGGLRISAHGMIVGCGLFNARGHDANYTEELIDNYQGIVAADKGFIDVAYQKALQRMGVYLITPVRSNMKKPWYGAVLKPLMRMRHLIETVNSQLNERFAIGCIRVRDLWHFQHRFMRKILAHTCAVFINLSLGRQPLDFDGLVK